MSDRHRPLISFISCREINSGANQNQSEMSEMEKIKIVVSNVYWLMEIKLQIICSISFSGETIRSNYKNKIIYFYYVNYP